jgi:trans-aconitate 2-methyltransferase
MPSWDPSQYLKFADHRLRPALDLVAHIPGAAPATVWDLGCGAGNVTKLLKDRWPAARVAGVDSSREMLAQAAAIDGISWIEGDVTRWSPRQPAEVVFSNAALHWIDDHAHLFPHLIRQVVRGGVLAVQMPRNFEAPSHTLLYETAAHGPWAAELVPYLRTSPVAVPEVYYDLLMPHATRIDIWETEYLHVLQGENAVLEWTKGSAVRPLLDRIDASQQPDFLAAYAERLRSAYPKRSDGMTLFPFRRLFIVAQR